MSMGQPAEQARGRTGTAKGENFPAARFKVCTTGARRTSRPEDFALHGMERGSYRFVPTSQISARDHFRLTRVSALGFPGQALKQ